MNNPEFKSLFDQAVGLHCSGQTQKALSAIEHLMANATSDGQRVACLSEKANLLFHLGLSDDAHRIVKEVTSAKKRPQRTTAI
ncbi:hypothetical protein [Bradyrhizobium sp.]|jgi:hypothetical protein|uniref:hypothetical protein n=1 Tax=Bradyrhizobium sp. TaxID=376 RepID=UPI002C9F5291|nr:hypothetical protein [Bradyrhizobium sp.]HWX64385.1 hypothetical protein [Bradyrhizobium sp.]